MKIRIPMLIFIIMSIQSYGQLTSNKYDFDFTVEHSVIKIKIIQLTKALIPLKLLNTLSEPIKDWLINENYEFTIVSSEDIKIDGISYYRITYFEDNSFTDSFTTLSLKYGLIPIKN